MVHRKVEEKSNLKTLEKFRQKIMFRKNVSKIVSMGYTGNLSTNKNRKKTSIKKRFHKKCPKDRVNGGTQKNY